MQDPLPQTPRPGLPKGPTKISPLLTPNGMLLCSLTQQAADHGCSRVQERSHRNPGAKHQSIKGCQEIPWIWLGNPINWHTDTQEQRCSPVLSPVACPELVPAEPRGLGTPCSNPQTHHWALLSSPGTFGVQKAP